MDLLFLGEESRANAVYGRISPSLHGRSEHRDKALRSGRTYLVVETTFLIEEVEELGVGFAPPEVKVANLEVTPD